MMQRRTADAVWSQISTRSWAGGGCEGSQRFHVRVVEDARRNLRQLGSSACKIPARSLQPSETRSPHTLRMVRLYFIASDSTLKADKLD